jgi:hypothetical protein
VLQTETFFAKVMLLMGVRIKASIFSSMFPNTVAVKWFAAKRRSWSTTFKGVFSYSNKFKLIFVIKSNKLDISD